MYFKEFPKMLYDFKKPDGSTETIVVRDITRNVRFRKEVLENISVYDEYDVQDGETPEIIAEKVYGNPEYHWVVMLANQRWEYIEDFPLDETSLARVIKENFNPKITATSWSYSGTTITVVAPSHGLKSSPAINLIVSGTTATTNPPNGTFSLVNPTIVDNNTFRFTVTNAPTGTAGGTMSIQTELKEYYTAHYISAEGFKVDSDYPGATGVSYEQMTREENESKRRIRLISKDALNVILQNYRDLM